MSARAGGDRDPFSPADLVNRPFFLPMDESGDLSAYGTHRQARGVDDEDYDYDYDYDY